MNKRKFAEYFVDSKNADEIASEINSFIDVNSKNSKWMSTINPHSYVTSQSDHKFSLALKNADWLIPDGIGIVIFSKLFDKKINIRVTGWDIFSSLNNKLNKTSGKSVFFLGSSEDTLSKISLYMQANYPNIKVAGMLSPPFKDEFDQKEINHMIDEINTASPDVLWVGLTAPKQEKWIFENISKLNVSFAGAIGAVFDFCAGNISRAPNWMQKSGLEWIHRSIMSPKRLGIRNLTSNPIFVCIIIKKWIQN